MSNNIIWLDYETTGLSPKVDQLLEAGVIVTDHALNPIDDGLSVVIHQPDSVLNSMDDFVTNMHTKNGLIEECRASSLSLAQAEQALLEYVQRFTEQGEAPMAGSNISFDRDFAKHHMPEFEQHFHYRKLDVSTIKELCRRWNNEAYSGVQKKLAHRALDDIRESLDELRHYQQHFMLTPDI